MIKIINWVVAILLLMFVFTSCKTINKMYYFNDQVPSQQQLDSLKQFMVQHIQVYDRIGITISSTDPSLTAYLNPFNVQSIQGGSSSQNPNVNGYLVNDEGNIEFPLLGKIKAQGLTTTELSKLIKDKLAYYYKDLFVNVNLNGRVYFLNGRQGSAIQMYNERLTIFEAIAQSGIQDAFDRKDQLWLIREDSGKRFYTQLNLNSKKIFESPYYYLHSNDLLYLKQSKSNYFFSVNSPFKGVITVLSALSVIILGLRSIKAI